MLTRHGITHVLVCARELPCVFEGKAGGPEYLKFDLADVPTHDIARHFAPACAFVDAACAGGGRVLAHCAAGGSRSAAICIAYALHDAARNGGKAITFDEALAAVKAQRPVVDPNWGFVEQLQKFAAELIAESTTARWTGPHRPLHDLYIS